MEITMDNADIINQTIDQLIREYAYKDSDGYHLWAGDIHDTDANDYKDLINLLIDKDDITKEILAERVKDLIDARKDIVEAQDRYNSGLRPMHDQQTGEVMWVGNYL